jgi:ABC-type polysaccharide/polyol phosphate transport system ATPase subunit
VDISHSIKQKTGLLKSNLLNVSRVSKYFPAKSDSFNLLLDSIIGRRYSGTNHLVALEDVSFSLRKGESVGVLGLNGSGKSTLLQIIAGTMHANKGNVQVSGKIASILELGSGFNTNFTGIENIFLNASLYGLSVNNTKEILDDIIDFSDIGDYIYRPVRTYSSGMVVRLAYGILANLKPELLLVDEALAVGDFLFQQKCFNSMRKLQKSGTGILFVSHSLNLISEFCDQVLVLHNGKQFFFGNIKEGVYLYEKILLEEKEKKSDTLIKRNSQKEISTKKESRLNSLVELLEINICDSEGKVTGLIETGSVLILKVKILFKKNFDDPHCGFKLIDENGKVCFGINTYSLKHFCGTVLSGQNATFEFRINQYLQIGKYSINIGIADGGFGYQTADFKNSLGYIDTNHYFEVMKGENSFSWSGPVFIDTNVRSHLK